MKFLCEVFLVLGDVKFLIMGIRQCATVFVSLNLSKVYQSCIPSAAYLLMLPVNRLASTVAAAAKESAKAVGGEELSCLPNGLTVFSKDLKGPVAQLVLAFRAGSRYEQPDEFGITHHLRNCIGIDSERAFGVHLLYQCGGAGATLYSHLTRDFLAVQASLVREHACRTLPLICELSQPAFKPWDLENVIETLDADIAYLKPHDQLSDCLHYAAFRGGPLGHSLYSAEELVGKYDYLKLRRFADSRLVSSQAVLVGINIDHDDILKFLNDHMRFHEKSSKEGLPSKYVGGEVRRSFTSRKAYVAIAGEGASIKEPENVAVQSVLLSLLVGERSLRYGPNNEGVVSRAKASGSYPYEIRRLSEVYSDSGLVGFCISSEADIIAPLVHAAAKSLKSISMNDDTVKKARRVEIFCFAMRHVRMAELVCLNHCESSSALALGYAAQLLCSKRIVSTSEFIQLIRSVTKQDLEKMISRMVSNMTIASCGNIYQVPYLDEL
ncbi:unnamed protein product [Enterobius vermicularis]|uniref:Cytochrome b-c1 complex subunit 2, mitochondrial n=1 Tax=Enterobius vermicularis TaxID=51028 RepID=A0A0N4VLR9_ENTVE|nr:unnamed protein product [Enterobius vermicularis]